MAGIQVDWFSDIGNRQFKNICNVEVAHFHSHRLINDLKGALSSTPFVTCIHVAPHSTPIA